jgi:hypothetical protein
MLVTLEFADAGGKSGSHSVLVIGRGAEDLRSDFILDRGVHRKPGNQSPVCEEAADALAARNRTSTPPSAYPDAERYPSRQLSALVAGNGAEFSPRFVVVSCGTGRTSSHATSTVAVADHGNDLRLGGCSRCRNCRIRAIGRMTGHNRMVDRLSGRRVTRHYRIIDGGPTDGAPRDR